MDVDNLPGTLWRHRRTGDVRRVFRYDETAGIVYLTEPRGGQLSLNPDQLANLYVETFDPADAAAFVNAAAPVETIKIGRIAIELNPPPPAIEPLPDRRRFNNGSVRVQGR